MLVIAFKFYQKLSTSQIIINESEICLKLFIKYIYISYSESLKDSIKIFSL